VFIQTAVCQRVVHGARFSALLVLDGRQWAENVIHIKQFATPSVSPTAGATALQILLQELSARKMHPLDTHNIKRVGITYEHPSSFIYVTLLLHKLILTLLFPLG
jgi:hypothetical protein